MGSTILVVCTGNTCRSPVVEALLKSYLTEAGYTDWEVFSAGIKASGGEPASKFGAEILLDQFAIDLSSHRSKKLSHESVNSADLILCMADRHRQFIVAEQPEHQPKVVLLSEMADFSHDLPDPYGQDKLAYQAMLKAVCDYLNIGLQNIIERAQT
ncbi:MAG: low molecular weight protein arginine phosphatase [Chloroflexota bacterium]